LILGDYTIQAQGTWDELKDLPEQISKIKYQRTGETQETLIADDHLKLQSQTNTTDDAVGDLMRKTGDMTIYSIFYSPDPNPTAS
jgi:hypothetical protein